MNIVYNGATSRTQIELTYDPKALNCWERFELDWEKFWSGTGGKVVAVTVFVAALVLAICCPQFAPILVTTVAGIGLTALIGGISGGLSSVENGGGFWSGFGSYIDENIAIIATSELIIAMATFGISQAVTSVKSVQPVTAAQTTKSELYSFELDPRSIELAKEGNPTFGTFRKRVWKNEAKFRPEKYENSLDKLIKGNAPVKEGYPMQLHHVRGKAVDMYDVVALTRREHIQFHKTYKYKINKEWNMENLIKMFGGIK